MSGRKRVHSLLIHINFEAPESFRILFVHFRRSELRGFIPIELFRYLEEFIYITNNVAKARNLRLDGSRWLKPTAMLMNGISDNRCSNLLSFQT
jgi:hypothetical protein